MATDHAETYLQALRTCEDPTALKFTDYDDELYEMIRRYFPKESHSFDVFDKDDALTVYDEIEVCGGVWGGCGYTLDCAPSTCPTVKLNPFDTTSRISEQSSSPSTPL